MGQLEVLEAEADGQVELSLLYQPLPQILSQWPSLDEQVEWDEQKLVMYDEVRLTELLVLQEQVVIHILLQSNLCQHLSKRK